MGRYSIVIALFLAGCADNFAPVDKVATYDSESKQLSLPGPCPDWSQSQTQNYANETHSNFGCSVNTNLAVQLDNPADLHHGHGKAGAIPELRQRYLQDFYDGKIPQTMSPLQDTGSSGGTTGQ